MRVLVVLHTWHYLRFHAGALCALRERGHDVALAMRSPREDAEGRLGVVADARPVDLPPERADRYRHIAPALRAAVDYVRYLDPRFASTHFLRERARGKAVASLPPIAYVDRLPPRLRGASALRRALLRAERAVPPSEEVKAWLADLAPDVVLVSPLVNNASRQTEVVKAARALGIPSGALVASWDNLTTKGHLRTPPDRVVVWNDVQRDEAVALHDVPCTRIQVVGAHHFDPWFVWRPRLDRAAFCARAGLPPDRPFVLYTGSTSNINDPDWEDAFIRRWIAALRAGPADVRDIGVVVRPHPLRRGRWASDALADVPGAVVWPPQRPRLGDPDDRAVYFDSLHHSAAVVGVNTSAMLEAAILSRPVLTIRVRDFQQAQDGTLHFQYVRAERGGFVREADDLDDHVAQLAAVLADPAAVTAELERFVGRFLRPHGIDRPVLPLLLDAIEALAATPAVPVRSGIATPALRALLRRADERLDRRWRVTVEGPDRDRAEGLERLLPEKTRKRRRKERIAHEKRRYAEARTARRHRREERDRIKAGG